MTDLYKDQSAQLKGERCQPGRHFVRARFYLSCVRFYSTNTRDRRAPHFDLE